MASVRNAFDLLAGGGAHATVSSSKSKKKSKKKSAQTSAATEAAINQGSQQSAVPIAPAPVTAPAATQPPKVQTAKDAAQALEASTVAAGTGEWGALAEQWTNQILHGDALYTDGSQLVDFKQVLLESRALDLLVEGCLERGATVDDVPALAQLLAVVAHPTAPPALIQAFANAVVSLGQVCATDQLAPTPAAKRAAVAALELVRRGVPKPPAVKAAEPPAAKLARLGGELGRHEARLVGTTQSKEFCKTYASILELLCAQLDVLRPAGPAAAAQAPEVAATLKPLGELRAALASRLQEVQAPPKPQLSPAEQVAEAEASHRKEDAALAGRLSEVEGRIAYLEAELAALKIEAGELRVRRLAAAQHHQHRLESIRSGKQDSGASPAQIAAAVQGGMGALDGLAGALGSGGAGTQPANGSAGLAVDAAALSQQVVAAEVPVKLLGAMQQVVELSLGQLHDLGAKARFFRERLDKAIKQGEQAAKLGLGDPKTFKQQRTTAENNVKEVLAAADCTAGAAQAAVSAYRERLPLMLRLPNFLPPPPEYLSTVEAKAAEAQAVLDSIKNGSYVPQPAAAAPPAFAEPGAAATTAAPATERPPSVGAGPAPGSDVNALAARLAALEAENMKKDAQIAAMISASTIEVPSPLASRTSMPPAMLSSPASNKPVGPAAPIAPSPATATAPGPAVVAASAPVADPEPEPASAPAASPAVPVITFSQALLQSVQPQANGHAKKAARPRRA